MIKVPFDTDGGGGYEFDTRHTTRKQLTDTLDHAYKTMEWFRYLADRATSVKVLDETFDAAEYKTRHLVCFELKPKHETFYRLKYQDT